MRHARLLAFGSCLFLLVGQTAFGSPVELSILTDPHGYGWSETVNTFQLDDSFQQGQFELLSGAPVIWPGTRDPMDMGAGATTQFPFGLHIYLLPPDSPPVPGDGSGPPYIGAPNVYISGTLEGRLFNASSRNLGADLHATGVTLLTENLEKSGLPQSVIDAFTDLSRIHISAASSTNFERDFPFANELVFTLSVSPPQTVPEPASWFVFAIAAVTVAGPMRRRTRTCRD